MFGAIGDQRVTFVEKKIDLDRMEFLKELLYHQGVTLSSLCSGVPG